MAIDDVIDGLMAAATHDVTFPIYLFGTVGKVMLWAAEATHDVTFPTYLFGTVGKMTSLFPHHIPVWDCGKNDVMGGRGHP